MRTIILFLVCLPTFSAAFAGGRSEKNLRFAAENLDKALEQKDTVTLNRLLSRNVQYGHSNGWIENKEELKAHLYNGKLVYRSIKGTGATVVIDGDAGLVREEVTIDVLLDGKALNLKLSVLQMWIFRKGEWILLGRQSTKV